MFLAVLLLLYILDVRGLLLETESHMQQQLQILGPIVDATFTSKGDRAYVLSTWGAIASLNTTDGVFVWRQVYRENTFFICCSFRLFVVTFSLMLMISKSLGGSILLFFALR